MTGRIILDQERRRRFDVIASLDGNITLAAQKLNMSRDTLQKWVTRNADAPVSPSISHDPFPDEDLPAEQILEHHAAAFRKRAQAAKARKWFKVSVNDKLPIGINWFGDPHLGSNGCNVDLLRRDVALVSKTPGMFGANIGDTVDNWSGKLIRLYAENDVSRKTERTLARWFLKGSGVKWIVWLEGNHDCHSEDTEVLTSSGWKQFSDVNKGLDLVLGFCQKTEGVFWQPIDEVLSYDYAGPMVQIESRGTSQLITPNHRVLLQARSECNGERAWTEWKYKAASEIPGCFKVPVSGKMINAPGCGLLKDEIRFAAWVLTDGSITTVGNHKKVAIYQSKDTSKIEALLASLNISFSHGVRHRRINKICGRLLVKDALPQHVYRVLSASTKYVLSIVPEKGRIPAWAWSMTPDEFDVFVESLIDGDGSWATSGKQSAAVLHGEKHFLSQVQALAVQNGWRATISVVRGKDYRLNLARAQTTIVDNKKSISTTDYSGKVWCLRVPSGNFMVRRAGKPCFSGNSMDGEFATYLRTLNAKQIPMMDWRAQFILEFPNARQFRIDAAHNHKGHSMWNDLHGQERASVFEEDADLFIAGHHHNWAFKVKELGDGRVVTLARVRGYKFLDSHADRWQFPTQQQGASGVTIFDPITDSPTERIRFYADVEAGCNKLTYLRQMYSRRRAA